MEDGKGKMEDVGQHVIVRYEENIEHRLPAAGKNIQY